MSVSFAVGARAHLAVAARGSTTATVRRAAVASSSSTLSARRSVALSSRVPTLITRSARAPRSGTRSNAVVVRAMATADTEVTAETVVRGMYDAINRRDVEAALAFVDDDILYEDFNFPTPFKGIGAVRKLFEESCDGIPDDMLFIVDECTDGGGGSVGMTWYVELEGEPFPNARGASFYRINPENGKLVYARDVVEPPFKLGDVSFSIIRAVAPAVKQQLRKKREAREAETGGVKIEIDQSSKIASSIDEPGNGVAAAGLYALGAVYWFVLLLSPPGWQGLPGEPAWAVATDTLNEVIAESTDFFFVLPVLNKFGVELLGPAPAVHPVTLGVFNFAEAFIFMLLPLMLMTRKGRDLPTVKAWSVAMFLTNALMLPYLGARAGQPASAEWARAKADGTAEGIAEVARGEKGALSKAFGLTGLGIGVLSVYWALFEDPAVGGDLAQRFSYLGTLVTEDRVSLAFVVDIALFSVWQAWFIGQVDEEAPAACRFVPYWGLAAWLML